MKLIRSLVPKNIHYKNNKIINVKGLVLHSVGTPQPKPDVFVRLWNSSSNQYLTQLVIGAEDCYEVLPCTDTPGKAVFCYHVGSANSYTIGAEMTEPSTIKYTGGSSWKDLNPEKTRAHVLATYKQAVQLFAYLCKFHNLDPLKDGVILSHSECHKRGIGTNHGDVEHIWNKFGLSMNQFRKDVKSTIDGGEVNVELPTKPEASFSSVDVPDYKVRVTADSLNIRRGPGTMYGIVSAIKDKGTYTIIEEYDGWGLLSSYKESKEGWIKLSYTEKVAGSEVGYKVKVTDPSLNIRKGPSAKESIVGVIKDKGVYTIVEESNGWGLLKGYQKYRSGWIKLSYTKKI